MKQFESSFAHHIFANVNLQAPSSSLQVGKSSFAHQAVGNNASCDRRIDLVGFQFRGRGLSVLRG